MDFMKNAKDTQTSKQKQRMEKKNNGNDNNGGLLTTDKGEQGIKGAL